MKQLNSKELKQYELDILLDIASFCEEHNLRYFLAYGTLIGAIRHKGFIPWDDDIDIQMPREDYEKFISLYNENKKCEYYVAISPYDKISKHSFLKVIDTRTVKDEKGITYKEGENLGIDVDIFPIDGQPETEQEFLKFYKKKIEIYKNFYCVIGDYKDYTIKNKVLFALRYLCWSNTDKNKWLDKIKDINSNYKYDECKYIGTTASLYNCIKNRTLAENYSEYILVDFEGHKLRAPVGYHSILTEIYGDYMKLPPASKQVAHHEQNIYLKD